MSNRPETVTQNYLQARVQVSSVIIEAVDDEGNKLLPHHCIVSGEMRAVFIRSRKKLKVTGYRQARFNIFFGEVPVFEAQPIPETLIMLAIEVERIIALFTKHNLGLK